MKPGFLIVDKPVGVRSSLCVERVRRALGRGAKTGHGGTLDSTASGVVVILIGGATRLSDAVMGMGKTYTASVRLGAETSTCDWSGGVEREGDASGVTGVMIDGLLPSFLGWRLQTPPKISAVHVGGRRAHELARAGEEPDIAPRPVFVRRIERIGGISADGVFTIRVSCGKGTYIRSLARDIGRALGCGAHIASLRRDSVGSFTLARAITPPDDMNFRREEIKAATLPVDEISASVPFYRAGEAEALRLSRGMPVPVSSLSRVSLGGGRAGGTIAIRSRGLLTLASLRARVGAAEACPGANIAIDGEPAE